MNLNNLKTLSAVFAISLLVSCDKDYNTIGGDIIGDKNFDIITEEVEDGVTIYDIGTSAVQTDNLSTNLLGVFNNGSVFGVTKANVVTQLSLSNISPTFNSGIVVDSVVLTLPYFSKKIETKSNGYGVYELSGIYKAKTDTDYKPISLKVFRSKYNLSDFDTQDPTKTAKYYSNQESDFDNNILGNQLNDTIYAIQNSAFIPSNDEFVKYKVDATTLSMLDRKPENVESRQSPRMRLKLNKLAFENDIIKASKENLASNNAFKNYYRGLYFQVQDATEGSLISLDFSKGDVTIYYKQDKTNDKPADGKEMKSLVLNMTANTVNTFKSINDNVYRSNVSTYNVAKEPKIYLKGGQGSMAFIDLDINKLNQYKNKGYLINDAYLEFTVDTQTSDVKTEDIPSRLYLYDADNNVSLRDYIFDITVDANGDAKKNKFIHGGLLSTENGISKYKIRITEHLIRYINDNSGNVKNVRLGLAITDNIALTTETIADKANRTLRTPINVPKSSTSTETLNSFQIGSVLSPLGVVLFGNTNDENRVKFIISYTKPK